MTRTTKQCLVLFLTVLGLYYPTFHSGGPNSLDDYNLLWLFQLTDHVGLASIFHPGQNFYYRPLTGLSFLLDKYLWNLEPSFMLLENTLIHLINALLVFFICRRLPFTICQQTKEDYYDGIFTAPLLAGLLFAVHPLATESVNWISGRTDPLATMYMLLATLVITKAVAEDRFWNVPVASVLGLCGILSKEMSLFFLPTICLLLFWIPAAEAIWPAKRRLRACVFFVLPFILAGGTFLFYRWYFFNGTARGFSFVVNKLGGNYLLAFGKAFSVFGFYVKKLFLPLPLNFAITDISQHYFWLGILSFFLCFVLVLRRSLAGRLLVLSFLLIVPAIILGVVRVAWTPYAERYVYMALPFFTIAITGMYTSLFDLRRPLVKFFPLFILLLCLPLVFQRNLIWTDNLTLYKDIVAKNPDFSLARHELAIALLKKDRTREAEQQLREGIRLIRPEEEERPQFLYATLAHIKLGQDRIREAETLLRTGMHNDKSRAIATVLQVWCELLRHKIDMAYAADEKERLFDDLMATYDKLFSQTGDPFFLDRAGKAAMEHGNSKLAAKYYHDVWRHAPAGSALKKNSEKLLAKLSIE